VQMRPDWGGTGEKGEVNDSTNANGTVCTKFEC